MTETIRFLIADEIEAIKGYQEVLEKVDNEELKKVLTEINQQEVEHIKKLYPFLKGE